MNHEVPHDLDPETARRVTEHAFGSYQARFQKYSPTFRWENEDRAIIGFSAKGIQLKGALEIKEKAIAMDLSVPFLLRPFQKKAVSVIEEEIRNWIAKAKAGEI